MKKSLRNCDKVLLVLMIIYSLFGLLMIFSASSVLSVVREHNSAYYYFLRQLIFVCGSYFIGLFIILRVPIKKYGKLIIPALVGLTVLLIGLIVKEEMINGSKSWYDFGIINFQPSEFVKTVFILFLANYFYKNQAKSNEKSYYIKPIIACVAITGLVLLQPDLGTSVIICGITALTILFIPMPSRRKNKIIGIFLLSLVAIGILFYFEKDKLLTDTQLSRLTYTNPCTRYTEATGYQVCNSLIAITNGGLFGVGLGNSTQKYLYLPAAHTDFIFAIIIEECGVIISSFILIGYLAILFRILKIARDSYNIRNSIIAFGVLIYMTLHIIKIVKVIYLILLIIINLFGITALIPITGIPLPFLSYGGSFNVNLIILLFLVQRVSIENNQSRIKKELKKI